MTAAQAGLLSVLRALLPEGSTQGSVARHQYVAALDIQDLWRWAKENPEGVKEAAGDP